VFGVEDGHFLQRAGFQAGRIRRCPRNRGHAFRIATFERKRGVVTSDADYRDDRKITGCRSDARVDERIARSNLRGGDEPAVASARRGSRERRVSGSAHDWRTWRCEMNYIVRQAEDVSNW